VNQNRRPINKNPLSIQLPVGAWVSITHRLSGLFIFLFIPLLLWLFQLSVVSPETFDVVKEYFDNLVIKFLLWSFLAALTFHLLAGIRHLLMDMHWGDSLRAARVSAKMVIVMAILIAVATVFWIWGA